MCRFKFRRNGKLSYIICTFYFIFNAFFFTVAMLGLIEASIATVKEKT